ncbi:Adenine-specific DNA methylase [Bordetella ansorpii]|uniref:Adenine-specific DNA methylase n=1 Tax=Bordetella ansorpii TaxID=288768 RepID=A0A157SB40_9BORD|nr:DNA adenine methylase [Bordetella ansorpii]SAI67491.1 Adenine-specific DNA methylase [Bordetella ansorpii]
MLPSAFRPIYYLGCKTEFSESIKAAIDHVDPSGGRLGDLFAGTGAVAAALAATREVVTVDIQEYSRVLCSAVLNPRLKIENIKKILSDVQTDERTQRLYWCFEPLITYENFAIKRAQEGQAEALIELIESWPIAAINEFYNSASILDEKHREVINRLKEARLWDSPDSTVSRLFGGVYFSYEQSVALDSILVRANSGGDDQRDTLVAAALSTASALVNTVGKHFAQPLRPRHKSGLVKSSTVRVACRDRTLDALRTYESWLGKYAGLCPAVGRSLSVRQDYLGSIDQLGSSLSVLYADPPYTRDHYSRFYHVLETMCLRDNPTYSEVKKGDVVAVSRGLYREDRHQSDFCVRSLAPAAFDRLFEKAQGHNLPLVLSYSPHEAGDGTHPRVVSMNQIMEIARKHYQRVEIESIVGSTHNILNRSSLKLKTREHAEVILKCFL